jgi:hypothetical protein
LRLGKHLRINALQHKLLIPFPRRHQVHQKSIVNITAPKGLNSGNFAELGELMGDRINVTGEHRFGALASGIELDRYVTVKCLRNKSLELNLSQYPSQAITYKIEGASMNNRPP